MCEGSLRDKSVTQGIMTSDESELTIGASAASVCFCTRVARMQATLDDDVRGSVAGARGRGVADNQSTLARQSVLLGRHIQHRVCARCVG